MRETKGLHADASPFLLLVSSPSSSTPSHIMAQVFNRLGGILPKGSGKGIFGGAGALIALGAVGYGVNASLFNGNMPNQELTLRSL